MTQIKGTVNNISSSPKETFGFRPGCRTANENNLAALTDHQNQQATLVGHMSGGDSSNTNCDTGCTVVVPQDESFNNTSPTNGSTASAAANLNKLTQQQHSQYDDLAFQQNEPTYNPPPVPPPKKGGSKNRRSKKNS